MTRLYIYAGILAALIAAGWFYGHTRYIAGVAHEQAAAQRATVKAAVVAQKQTVAADAGAKAATDTGQAQIAANEVATHETVRTITRIVHDAPSPVACVVHPDGLRALQRAASAANTASRAVSGTGAR